VAVLRDELLPEIHVAVLHPRELQVERALLRVALAPGELAVEEGGVGLILEVVPPGSGDVGARGHGGILPPVVVPSVSLAG
jgi:hypothetical protein